MSDIPDIWIGHPGPVQGASLGVTLSPGLRDAIRAAAEKEGVSASYWMRRAAVAQLERIGAESASQ